MNCPLEECCYLCEECRHTICRDDEASPAEAERICADCHAFELAQETPC